MFGKKPIIDIKEELDKISDTQPAVNAEVPTVLSDQNEGFIANVKAVFGRIWLLIKSPKEALQSIYQNDGIGIPMGVLMFGILLLYIIVMIGGFIKGAGIVDDFSILSDMFTGTSMLILILFFFVFVVYMAIAFIMSWSSLFFSGHVFASIYGGNGKWYKYAVAVLYIQLAMMVMLYPAALFYFIVILVAPDLITVFGMIYFILTVAISVWYVILNVIATELHYQLSKGKAILAVVSPVILMVIIIGLFLFTLSGLSFFNPFGSSRSSLSNDLSSINWNYNINRNLNNTNSPANSYNSNRNYNSNSNISIGINNSGSLLDSDGDGLTDDQEKIYGTKVDNPDSDGDGFSDSEEIKGGYNPIGEGLYISGWTECIDLAGYNSCSDYCESIDKVCNNNGITSRTYDGWGAEAWSTPVQCASGTAGSGQLKCDEIVKNQMEGEKRWKCNCQ